MPLLNLKDASLHVGLQALLDKASFSIEPGERLCILGRNGEGKSTLFGVLQGQVELDEGVLEKDAALKLSGLAQTVPSGGQQRVFDLVAQGLGELGQALAQYHHLLQSDPEALQRIGELQAIIDAQDGWSIDARVAEVLTRLQLDGEMSFDALSGGLKRRVLLAQALVTQPDVLLLDEPTNHLDIDSIRWLEEFLKAWNGTLIFITHDRAFLRSLATRIVELDRGQLTSFPGDYDTYLRRKQELLDAEASANSLFDKKLAQEEVWIRQGIQARRTRNEGRVRALKQMREEFGARRQRSGTASFSIQEAQRSGKLVLEVENMSYSWGETQLVDDFNATILRGDKIGIIGPNGVGKTTLLKLLLGQLQAQRGEVKIGTKLEIAYFDQLRAELNPDMPVFDVIGDGQDFVQIGQARKHVLGYLQDFLFTPDRARSPVRSLSGGEISRLLLARLFTKPCNVLVLDEPTNDLDLETLDLLEERLLEFKGTVFLVSHDREFINRVVTRSFVFEGQGRVGDYVGGYDDWLRQRPRVADLPVKEVKVEKAKPKSKSTSKPEPGAKRLSHEERKELMRLPGKIERMEAEQTDLAERLSAPKIYEDASALQQTQDALLEIESKIAEAYLRWEALDSKSQQ